MSGLTKILIVLQLVFSIVLSVALMMMVSKQERYKDMVESAQARSLASAADSGHAAVIIAALTADKANAERDLNDAIIKNTAFEKTNLATVTKLEGDIQRLTAENTAKEGQVSITAIALNTSQNMIKELASQIDGLNKKVPQLITQNGEVARRNNELENENRASAQAIRQLQEQLANLPATPTHTTADGGNLLGKQVTTLSPGTANQINGQISDIRELTGRTYIETPLGTRDGVNENTKLAIYRGNSYVGDAVVQKATPDQSVAVVTFTNPGQSVQKGDLVMSGK